MASQEYDYLFKLIIIGDSGVGKSSLLVKFIGNIGNNDKIDFVDFIWKTIEINGKRIKLEIWDTAGQENLNAITSNFFRGAHGMILVYDSTNKKSFDNVLRWVDTVEEHTCEYIHKVLVGNRNDFSKEKVVHSEMGQALADQLGVTFLEISTRDVSNIDDVFHTTANEILRTVVPPTPTPKTTNTYYKTRSCW